MAGGRKPGQTTGKSVKPIQSDTKTPDMFAKLPNPCVYCGPSVKGVALQYTTYQGGVLPEPLRAFIQRHPEVMGLLVSPGEFPAMRRRLETRGTPEAALFQSVKGRL